MGEQSKKRLGGWPGLLMLDAFHAHREHEALSESAVRGQVCRGRHFLRADSSRLELMTTGAHGLQRIAGQDAAAGSWAVEAMDTLR
jgi:hypothetical protein